MSKRNGKHAIESISPNGHKRAVLLARVSTKGQEDNFSLDDIQLPAMREYAERNQFRVIEEITDKFTGNSAVADRPGGSRVYDYLRRKAVDVVVLYTLDRTARDDDAIEYMIFKRDVKRAGAELHFVDTGKVADDLFGGLIEQMKAVGATDERKRINKRMSDGRNAKAKAGQVVGSGPRLYGYAYKGGKKENGKKEDGEYIINETDAAIVRLIYKWYTQGEGDSKPWTFYAIAHELSRTGIPTPGESRPNRKRGAGMWNQTAVKRILSNEAYAGVWRYGKLIGKDGCNGRRPDEELIRIDIPAIVTPNLWMAAQTQREYNRKMSPRNNTKNQYLLRGIVKCGCGYTMAGFQKPTGATGYHCTWAIRRFADIEGKWCSEKEIRSEALEGIAWDKFVMGLFSDPVEFEKLLHKAQAAEAESIDPKQERLATILGIIAECEDDADRLTVAMKRARKGGVVGQSLQRQIDDLENHYTKQTEARDKLLAEIEGEATITDEDIGGLMQFRADVALGMQYPTFEDKRQALELLRVSIVVKDGKATVSCRLPVGERVFDLHTSRSALINNARWITLTETYSLADALFAGVPVASIIPAVVEAL